MGEARKLAAILVADVVGYCRLAGADEERTLARLRGLRRDLIDPAIAAHRGRVVKGAGDGSIDEQPNFSHSPASMIKYANEADARSLEMADIERLTITLPAEIAATVRGAVAEGGYASASEVVREALRDWKMKRALQIEELAALKADIDKGLADVAAGRVKAFDAKAIVARGRKLLAARSTSA